MGKINLGLECIGIFVLIGFKPLFFVCLFVYYFSLLFSIHNGWEEMGFCGYFPHLCLLGKCSNIHLVRGDYTKCRK